jgi:hypothetical protein
MLPRFGLEWFHFHFSTATPKNWVYPSPDVGLRMFSENKIKLGKNHPTLVVTICFEDLFHVLNVKARPPWTPIMSINPCKLL